MTTHEVKLVNDAIARTRHELRDRVAAPGPQDASRNDSWHDRAQTRDRVSKADADEIRNLIRGFTRR